MNKVLVSDIERNLGFSIHDGVKDRILSDGLEYEELTTPEFNDYILNYLKVLNDDDLKIAGEHRKKDWEEGWNENLLEYIRTNNIDSLIPKYHTKSNISRLNGNIVKTFNPQFDFILNSYFIDATICKYAFFERLCEFGCGTGYHLFRLYEESYANELVGLDWSKSSQDIISYVAKSLGIQQITSNNFDYFKPDESFNVKDSCVYTVASLEQIGDKHKEFVDYLVRNKPKICIHFEPIHEVLNDNNLLDYLTKKYFEKRNYLKNFVTYLKELESQNKIQIIKIRRLNYGSKFIEGHTLVIWKPL